MKSEIIPTILVKTFDEAKEKIKLVENYVNWVQLDIMDGIFVENITWNNPDDLKNFKTKVKTEAHLMVQEPEKIIDKWLSVVDRVIVHFESKILDTNKLIEKIHNQGKQIGLALNPETNIEALEPFLSKLDLILLMSVNPGRGGQEFKLEILKKIKNLRNIWPNGDIEVDGGINNENIEEIIKAGANLFNIGNYIYKSQNTEQTIHQLAEKIK
jgi:ribulose-phosphate 3-epimerase